MEQQCVTSNERFDSVYSVIETDPAFWQVNAEINGLFMRLPNLLDSRVPNGDGEADNVVVSEWGQEYIKNGEVMTGAKPFVRSESTFRFASNVDCDCFLKVATA